MQIPISPLEVGETSVSWSVSTMSPPMPHPSDLGQQLHCVMPGTVAVRCGWTCGHSTLAELALTGPCGSSGAATQFPGPDSHTAMSLAWGASPFLDASDQAERGGPALSWEPSHKWEEAAHTAGGQAT